MFTLFIRLIFLVAAAAAIWAIWKAWERRSKKKSPEEKLQDIIDEQTEGLHAATEALRASESYVRQIGKEVEAREEDVTRLEARVKILVRDHRDDEAKGAIRMLQTKENDLADKKTAHERAVAEHHKYALVVDEYRQSIKDLKQEANELQIRSKLATAERRAASLATDMKSSLDTVGLQSARDELEQRIAVAKAEADVDRKLASTPEDEFLRASAESDTTVEDRLAQFKREMN